MFVYNAVFRVPAAPRGPLAAIRRLGGCYISLSFLAHRCIDIGIVETRAESEERDPHDLRPPGAADALLFRH